MSAKSKPNLIKLWAFLVSIFLALIIQALGFYFHEAGHIFFGYLTNIVQGFMPSGLSLKWDFLFFIPYPKQTEFRIIKSNYLASFGGPIFTLLFAVLLLYALRRLQIKRYKNLKILKCAWFLILVLYLYEAIFSSVIFGTDNWKLDRTSVLSYADYPLLQTIVGCTGAVEWAALSVLLYFVLFPRLNLGVVRNGH